jgi:magnesium-transporting ATPase (P-type)
MLAPVEGLTGAEAEARRRRGEANTAVQGGSRSYAEILRTNVLSFFNLILFVIGAALLSLGRYSDALISVGLGLINAVISAAQEIRAKRKLDRLQLLDRTGVLVVRDGHEVEMPPAEVVRGDVVRVRPGDQIVVDGPLLIGGRVEADESLLTGESDPVVKHPGDELRSGSLCVAGDGHQQARDVGVHSYAGRLTAEARRATTDRTPLQRGIEFIVRLVMALTALMSGCILAQAALEGMVTEAGTWVLGAPDALAARLRQQVPAAEVTDRTGRGLRVLLLARAEDPDAGLRDAAGRPDLPMLIPVALAVLADELRADVVATVARFHADGVEVKVLSGDDPRTVAAIAARAGLAGSAPVPGADLDDLDDPALDRLVARTAIFGRVAPEHKERIVRSLRRQGRYVAMIGDGVNDARALKQAHVGVAMRSGSAVTRDVADIVLVDDDLSALPPARHEGRRIINGIGISLYVFLARVVSQGLVILAVSMLQLGFPYSPTQVGLTMFTVGIPTVFLTFWAKPDRPDPHMLRNLVRFVVPASVVTATFGTAIYTALYTLVSHGFGSGRTAGRIVHEFEKYTGLRYAVDADFTTAAATILAQTGLSTFFCFASFLLILFLAPRSRVFAAWTAPTGDKRPALLVLGLSVLFSAVLCVPALWSYFGLMGPSKPVFLVVLPALILWYLTLTVVFRFRLFDRLLGLDRHPDS